jgi:hypothetical protein
MAADDEEGVAMTAADRRGGVDMLADETPAVERGTV